MLFEKFIKKRKCNHDKNGMGTTLRLLTKRVMISPSEKTYICENCKKICTYKD